jgi:deoxyribose-phosphate aldolase
MTSQQSIARFVDHTLLKPEATPQQIEQLCVEALAHSFFSVCVNGLYVPLCARLLQGSEVAVCTVIGFPLGAMSTAAKVFEAEDAIRAGAREVDMVLAIGRLRAGDDSYVREDIAAVASAAHTGGARLKVILETALLDDEQKRRAAALCLDAGADFVKTSTGFGGGGATVADVALLRAAVGERAGVKASGGIRNLADAQAMLAAGANRLGTSAGVAIVQAATGGTSEVRGGDAY